MQIQESNEDGIKQPGEWLNLRLGRNQESKSESESESRPATIKVYSCNFCRRKFYSSQALGGHQNAHKRERGAARHYQLHTMARSLGVQAHSHIHKPAGMRDGPAVSSRFIEPNSRFGLAWQPQEAAALLWPGSFRFGPKQPEQKSDMLDLNLKL